jgi:hypothetical protein
VNNYDDIINLPYKKSTARPQMSMLDRAAQFSPFAALTGHKEVTQETARLTEQRTELDDYFKAELNQKLHIIIENKSQATITYFLPDDKKEGGKYVMVTGAVKKYDEYNNTIKITDGTVIPIGNITNIELT